MNRRNLLAASAAWLVAVAPGLHAQTAPVRILVPGAGGNIAVEAVANRFVHAEIQRWAKVVKFSGAKPE